MSLPLVLEVQRMAVDQSSSVVQLVRTAKLVATKLSLPEATGWIDRELNGYPNLRLLPKYRIFAGECRWLNIFHGWQPVQFPDSEIHDACSEARVGQSLGSMEPLLVDDGKPLFLQYPFELQKGLRDLFQTDSKFAIKLPKSNLVGIFDAVRNLTLDWSLQLEQAGVLGENMSFTVTEKMEAKPVSQQFFIQNAGVVGNVTDNATVTNNQTLNGPLSISGVLDLVSQAKTSIAALPAQTQAHVAPVLDDLETEARKPAPDQSRMRNLLGSAKTICEGAVGNLVATAITVGITALLAAPK
ncbi:hypothetical protein P3T23_004540 [Paraburkholderia sp. GAS448]|uniref:AbiTii domain-containing protein n=1 Tax=Paraburkholderia sp. GAS448 TaxID=3035136 RepID=UPI003D234340